MFDADRLKLAVALLWEAQQAADEYLDSERLPFTQLLKRTDEFLREYRESRPAYGDPALVDGAKR